MIVLNYPHDPRSLQPRRLRSSEIWSVGEHARLQICGPTKRARIDVASIIGRARQLRVNGLAFETHWELGHAVADNAGNPVMGAVEHDENLPLAVMIYLNGELIGERDDLARSTAAHELGHAIFDAPAWIHLAQGSTSVPVTERCFRAEDESEASEPNSEVEWQEWRANEFMGAFLAPRQLLHRYMHNCAASIGVPMTARNNRDLPIVNADRAGFGVMDKLSEDLAERFGLSIRFIEVRLQKYGLVAGW